MDHFSDWKKMFNKPKKMKRHMNYYQRVLLFKPWLYAAISLFAFLASLLIGKVFSLHIHDGLQLPKHLHITRSRTKLYLLSDLRWTKFFFSAIAFRISRCGEGSLSNEIISLFRRLPINREIVKQWTLIGDSFTLNKTDHRGTERVYQLCN